MRKPLRHDHPGPLARWRARAAERHGQRLLAARQRRRLASSLRRAANCVATPSRHTVLIPDRVAAVRDELLEHSGARDASWVLAVHKLLTDGCKSPLYNSEIHISELRATLYYLRSAHRLEPASLG